MERNVNIPSESGEQVATYLTIRVLDDSTYGISASEVDDGLDSIGVSLNTGGTAEVRTISRVIDDANGLLRLLIR